MLPVICVPPAWLVGLRMYRRTMSRVVAIADAYPIAIGFHVGAKGRQEITKMRYGQKVSKKDEIHRMGREVLRASSAWNNIVR